MLNELFAACVAVLTAQAPAQPEATQQVGPTPIRFYAGNLSVGRFRAYWGTAAPGPGDPATPEGIALLKRASCTSMCDYVTWCTVESAKGKWDWSFFRRNADLLKGSGLGYNVFCWLHFPPKWYMESPDFVPYTELTSGDTIPQLSLWAPKLAGVYDEFYRRMKGSLGQRIDFIRVAMPSEYGEVGYCSGMTAWLVPQPKARPGWWCCDKYARTAFARDMVKRYGSVGALNKAWGTSFAGPEQVAMPDPGGVRELAATDQGRERWLDFVEWYNEAWVQTIRKTVTIARKHFPKAELIVSLGYGSEAPQYGNDQGRHIKVMKQLRAAAQTPGAIGYFATRRVSSACRAYGVPYYTEPPGGVDRAAQVNRIWMDASNGTQTWFDYPQNLTVSIDLLARYKEHLTGQPPVCDLVLWLPTYHQWLNTGEGWPARLSRTADALRERCDYELADDGMLRDGALAAFKARLLVLVEADCLDAAAIKAVEGWVGDGGVLISFQTRPVDARGGDAEPWRGLAGEGPAYEASDGKDWKALWTAGRALGKGRVLLVASKPDAHAWRAELISHFNHHLPEYGPYRDAPLVDDAVDGVLTTVMTDRVLYFNEGKAPVEKTCTIAGQTTKVTVPPGEILAVPIGGRQQAVGSRK